jgi:hypothetical protein
LRHPPRAPSVVGKETDILGWASYRQLSLETAAGDLVVHLTGVPVPAPYDIILLGPTSHGLYGQYEYAVVSDPFQLSLFVLARNVSKFNLLYNQTVFNELEALGFDTFLNMPEATEQIGCPEFSETDLSYCNGEFGASA